MVGADGLRVGSRTVGRRKSKRVQKSKSGERSLGPGMEAREPARDVGGEIGVVGTEHFAESRFFVKEDEEVDAEDDYAGCDDYD